MAGTVPAGEDELALVSIFFFGARILLGNFRNGFVEHRLADDVLLARPVAQIEQAATLAAKRKFGVRRGIGRLPADWAVVLHSKSIPQRLQGRSKPPPRVPGQLPIVQVVASVPATALFPIIVLLLTRVGGGLAVGSIVPMFLGTQWYILFNVIAGAIALPTDLKEVCGVFQFGRWERWRELILPGIFTYLITGFVIASGGAWNASILAEYFHLKGQTYSTTGLGAVVSEAADKANYPVLLVATMLMALIVLTINRLVWRRLYTLASTRFKLET